MDAQIERHLTSPTERPTMRIRPTKRLLTAVSTLVLAIASAPDAHAQQDAPARGAAEALRPRASVPALLPVTSAPTPMVTSPDTVALGTRAGRSLGPTALLSGLGSSLGLAGGGLIGFARAYEHTTETDGILVGAVAGSFVGGTVGALFTADRWHDAVIGSALGTAAGWGAYAVLAHGGRWEAGVLAVPITQGLVTALWQATR